MNLRTAAAAVARFFFGPSAVRRPPSAVRHPLRARYDAAQTGADNRQHWAATDCYDADSAHSAAVRGTLCRRSRYEIGNNGHGKGLTLTQAAYVVGRGPKLRVQTGMPAFNAMVEAAWLRWCRRVKLPRKLRTAVKAKVGDGEALLIVRRNENLADRVKLDLTAIETEQCATPHLPFAERNRIDGIQFDEFGNPTFYDILPQHPGSSWWTATAQTPERVPAKFVLHLFRDDRPGQHRGVPEITSTLGLFAQGRRYREATVAAAETAADFGVIFNTNAPPDNGPDEFRPLEELEIDKRMAMLAPMGWEAKQMKAEHPPTTYDQFTRSQIGEQARPLSMPYNIAACDSSGYSFSGGKLDHLTYFVSVDVEQQDLEDLVLDPLFELWFQEAGYVYGWTGAGLGAPAHTWDWPARPQIDEGKTANARKTALSFGGTSLRRIYAEDGLDLEDELAAMAADYGVDVEVLRAKLFEINFQRPGAAPAGRPPDSEPDAEALELGLALRARGRNGTPATSH